MIHKNFIELSRLMKEKGIEVGSGEWVFNNRIVESEDGNIIPRFLYIKNSGTDCAYCESCGCSEIDFIYKDENPKIALCRCSKWNWDNFPKCDWLGYINKPKIYPFYTMVDILTVAFGERVWGNNQYQLNNQDKRFHCEYHLIRNRDAILYLWDIEGNRPLHECPKLCAWLVGEVKNLK